MNRLAAALLFASAAIVPLAAQTAAIAPPTSGLLVNYSYWPTQYVQWVGNELPYSMLELDVDTTGKQPLLYVSLTERASGKRIHYTNSDMMVGTAKAMGEEVHKTEIAFEGGDTTNPGSTCNLRFAMADGKPLEWRFVQGSDISEQGSGLTDLGAAKIPIFAYREQGAVAGEGTTLQIGDVTSTAEVWKEISHPPYFVGYRGALTQSAHMVVFTPGKESWTIASAPSKLVAGGAWELDGATGNHRTLRIEKVEGEHVTIIGNDRFQPLVRFTLDANRAGDAWTINSVKYAPVRDGDKHFVTLQMGSAAAASDKAGSFSIAVGKKKPIATGTLAASGSATDRKLVVDFTTPTWAHGKTLTEQTVVAANGVSTAVTQ